MRIDGMSNKQQIKQQIRKQKIKAKEHIKRMEAIIKATEPFVTQDRSVDFQTSEIIRDFIKSYHYAVNEIYWTKEKINSYD